MGPPDARGGPGSRGSAPIRTGLDRGTYSPFCSGWSSSGREGTNMRRRGVIFGLCAALIGAGLVGGSLLPAVSQETTNQTFRLCEKNNTGSEKFINESKDGLPAGGPGGGGLPFFD